MPRSSVIRFDSSAEMSHSVAAGTSPVFDHCTVGSDSSSATQGSSVAKVAVKNRGPTKQCARASAAESATNRSANANVRKQLEEQNMSNLHKRMKRSRPGCGRVLHDASGGPRERCAFALALARMTTDAGGSSRLNASCGG